jgi:hypothetical protein
MTFMLSDIFNDSAATVPGENRPSSTELDGAGVSHVALMP